MKNLTKLLFFVSIAFVSCSDNEFDGDSQTSQSPDVFTFIYDGVTYSSEYELLEDSVISFFDKDVAQMYNELDSMPQLATWERPDGLIEYFENSEIAMKKLGLKTGEVNAELRAATSVTVGVMLYKDWYLTGTSLGYGMSEACSGIARFEETIYPTTTHINLNDEVTSIGVYGLNCPSGALLIYEDINYGGKSLVLSFGRVLNYYVNNLGDYKLKSGSLFSSSKSWNDQASSLKLATYY